MHKHNYIKWFVYIFCSILILGFLGTTLKSETDKSIVEGRRLARQPNLTFYKLISGEAYKEMDNFFNDQMLGRDLFQEIYYKIQNLLGQMDINNIIKGKDGYLFEKIEYETESLEYIKHNILKLEELNDYMAREGKNLYVAIAPRSEGANKNKIPRYYSIEEDKYLDLFFEQVNKKMNLIDLRENIYKKEELYYRTDHHWNMYGVFTAYQQIIDVIKKDSLDVQNAKEISDYEIKVIGEFYGSHARKVKNAFNLEQDKIEVWYPKFDIGEYSVQRKGKQTKDIYSLENIQESKYANLYSAVYNGHYGEVKYSIKNNIDKENVLVFGDSFMLPLPIFISNHFYNTYGIYLREMDESINLKKYIEDRNINNVIILLNSRFILKEKLMYTIH